MPRLNLIGQKFGRLYVKDFAYIKNKRTFWICVCDCNPEKEIIIMGKYLTNGDTRSCGCLNLEKARQMGLNNKEYNDYYIIDDIVHIKLGAFDNFQDAVNARLAAEQKYFKEYSRNQYAEVIS